MKKIIILFVLFISVSVFGQKGYQVKSGTDQMAEKLKNADVSYVQGLIDITNTNDPALPVLKALLLEKQKKQVLQRKRKNNAGSVNNGSGNNNSSSSKTDSLLVVLIGKVDGLDSRLSNVETRLDGIETQIAGVDKKIDQLSEKIVALGFSFEKSSENNSLIFLKKGELMVFHNEYLALTTNDEVLMDFVKSLSGVLGIRLNPLDFVDYANGSLTGEPKVLVEKVLKVVGSVDTEDPEIIWEYFVEQGSENAGLIRQTFEKF